MARLGPEFVGDFLALDLPALLEISQRLYSGEIERYDTVEHVLEGHRSYFVFQPLSDDTVRIAFQTREQIDHSLEVPYPTPKSARGYVVDTGEFCHTLIQCAKEFQQKAETFDVATDGFAQQITEFESLLSDTA